MAEYLPLYNIYKKIIYMCDAFKASHYTYLRKKNIRAMLYLSSVNKDAGVIKGYTDSKIQHYFVEVPDDMSNCDFISMFKKCIKIIGHFDRHDGRIVVYCKTGCHYAPLAISAYFLHKFYVVEGKKSQNGKSIVVSILNIISKENKDISLNDISHGIMSLASFERMKINERDMISKLENTDVEIIKHQEPDSEPESDSD